MYPPLDPPEPAATPPACAGTGLAVAGLGDPAVALGPINGAPRLRELGIAAAIDCAELGAEGGVDGAAGAVAAAGC